jgi:hypothetical protein
MIDYLARLTQLQVNHACAISAVALGQGHYLLPQSLVAIWRRLVTERTRTHADDLQGSSLT